MPPPRAGKQWLAPSQSSCRMQSVRLCLAQDPQRPVSAVPADQHPGGGDIIPLLSIM